MGKFLNLIALIGIIFFSLKGIALAALCVGLNILGYYTVSPYFLWLGIPAGIAAVLYYVHEMTH